MNITGIKDIDNIILNMKWGMEHVDKYDKVLKEFMKSYKKFLYEGYYKYYCDIRINYLHSKYPGMTYNEIENFAFHGGNYEQYNNFKKKYLGL